MSRTSKLVVQFKESAGSVGAKALGTGEDGAEGLAVRLLDS